MSAPGSPKYTISVRVKPENLEKIDRIAKDKKWTRSQAVDEAIEAYGVVAKKRHAKKAKELLA